MPNLSSLLDSTAFTKDTSGTYAVLKPTPGFFRIPVITVSSSGASQALAAPTNGNSIGYDITLTSACTLSLTGGLPGYEQIVTVKLRQDSTAGRAVTLPTVTWPTGTPPTLNTKAGFYDTLAFRTTDGGATWDGMVLGLAQASAAISLNAFSGTIYGGQALTASGSYLGAAPTNINTSTDAATPAALSAGIATISNGAFSFPYTAPSATGAHTLAVQETNAPSIASGPLSFTVAAAVAPTNVTQALNSGNGQITITASGVANGAAITTFSVLRGTTAGGESATPIGTITPAQTPQTGTTAGTYTDTTVTNGTAYYYKVVANTTAGNTTSAEGTATPSSAAPAHYLNLPGSSGGAGATNTAANDGSGNFLDIQSWVNLTAYSYSNTSIVLGRYVPANGSGTKSNSEWAMILGTNGALAVYVYTGDGTFHYAGSDSGSSAAANLLPSRNPSSTSGIWLRAVINAGTAAVNDYQSNSIPAGTVRLYTSPDGSTWSQLGSDVSIGTNGLNKLGSTGSMIYAAPTANGVSGATGKFYKAIVRDGTGALLVNADFTSLATGTTTFNDTAATPNAWSIYASSTEA